MRFARGTIIVVVGVALAAPLAALLPLLMPARDPGSEIGALRVLALNLLGYVLCLAIGLLLSKRIFDAAWKVQTGEE